MSEDLIRIVKKYRNLYDPKYDNYNNRRARDATWAEIARQQNSNAKRCRNTWQKLRKCYSGALKRQSRKKGQAATSATPWRYAAEMSFLLPFMEEKPSRKKNSSRNKLKSDMALAKRDKPKPDMALAKRDSLITLRRILPSKYPNEPRIESKEKNDTNLRKVIDTIESSEQETRPHSRMDGTDLFFQSMSQCVKRLSKIEQVRIKMDIHKIINKAEMRQLLKQQEKELHQPMNVRAVFTPSPVASPTSFIERSSPSPSPFAYSDVSSKSPFSYTEASLPISSPTISGAQIRQPSPRISNKQDSAQLPNSYIKDPPAPLMEFKHSVEGKSSDSIVNVSRTNCQDEPQSRFMYIQ